MASAKRQHPLSSRTFLVPLGVLLLGLLATGLLFLGARRAELNAFQAQLERDSALRTESILKELEGCRLISTSLRQFFHASDKVERHEFTTFTRPLLESHRGIRAFEWIPRVPHGNLPRFEREGRQQLGQDFRFYERGQEEGPRPLTERDTHFPVFFLEPLEGNERALGFDLASDPLRRTALERAQDTGEPAITERLRLVQDPEGSFGFLMFLPVYGKGLPQTTVDQRRRSLEGFVLGVVSTHDLISAALQNTDPIGLSFEFLDLAARPGQQFLHRWLPRETHQSSWRASFLPQAPRLRKVFPFAGRNWALEFTPTRGYMEQHASLTHWLLLLTGGLASLLLAIYANRVVSRSRRLELLVQERTERLGLLLDSMAEAIYGLDLLGRCTFCNPACLRLLGYLEPGELLGRNMHNLIHHTRRDGSPFPEGECQIIKAFKKGEGAHVDDEVFWRKDGTPFPAEYRSYPQRKDGEIIGAVISFVDITARRQAEEALRKISTAVEQSPLSIVITDVSGSIEFVNPYLTEVTGYRGDELLGRNPNLFKSGLHSAEAYRDLWNTILAGGTWRGKLCNKKKNGELFWERASISPIRNERGVITHFVGIKEDITEHRRAEAALLLKNFVFNASIAANSIADLEGVITETNPAFLRLWGFATAEEALGRTVPDLFLEPEEAVPVFSTLRAVGSWEGEFTARRQDGSTFLAYTLATDLRDEAGALIGYQASVQDVTDRKKADLEIQSLKGYLTKIIDSMPTILVGLDPEGRISQWNQEAVATTGIPPLDAMGQSLEFALPEFFPWIEPMRAEVLRTGEPVFLEKALLEKEGQRTFFDIMLYPLGAHTVEGMVVRIEDITARIRTQEIMIQAGKMMSVGGLAAGMAHEINNPLGIISQGAQNIERRLSPELPANRAVAEEIGLDLELLKRYFLQRKIPEFVASIQEAVARATRIIGNMLQFSRRADSHKVPAALSEILEQTLDLAANDYDLKKKYDFRSIEILRDFAPDVPLIPVVVSELEQVLLNLLENAAHAMQENPPDRPPRLTLRIWKEAGYGVLEVEDNGPGLDEASRRRIFEPFFTTKGPGLGTGLGLSVSYVIITQNHKGLLEVDSAPNQGARFTIRLPLDEGNSRD
jgi:PAS domain S-box-containing protein